MHLMQACGVVHCLMLKLLFNREKRLNNITQANYTYGNMIIVHEKNAMDASGSKLFHNSLERITGSFEFGCEMVDLGENRSRGTIVI